MAEFRGDSVSIPLHFAGNTPLVDVFVNGHGPFTFVFDTGCTQIVFGDDLIKELNLSKLGPNRAGFDTRGTTITSTLYQADIVSIGQIHIKNVAISNLDMRGLKNSIDPNVKGIIGYLCFRQSCLRFDFPNSRLIILKNLPPPIDKSSSLPLKAQTPAPYIAIRLGHCDFTVMIDTGCNRSLVVSEAVATSLTLYRTRSIAQAFGAKLDTFSVVETRHNGNLSLSSIEILDPYVEWAEKVPGSNVIGMEILKHLVVDIDFINGIARFHHTGGSISISDRKLFGVFIKVSGKKAKVASVDPRLSARNIDVQPGDEVIKIDGVPANRVPDHRMKKLIAEKDSIPLLLRRNQKEFTCEVPVLLETYSK